MNTILSLLKSSMRAPKLVVGLAFGAILTTQIASAQVGNDNPTGLAGQFNGNITTGCSYDPYTGNAMRAVTDIVVAGSVGAYPLSFSRVSNSRFAGASGFGIAGAWRHSYAWELNASEESLQHNFQPTQYPVAFPDGREVTFVHSFSDTYFRAPAPGIRERFIPLNLSTMRAYLILPDGGKIRFKATQYSWTEEWGGDGPPATPPPELTSNRKESEIRRVALRPTPLPPPGGTRTWWGYTYEAEAIIDPYGQETTLTYSDGYLTRIQEPAINPTDPGRKSIDIHYTTSGYEQVIDYIQGSDGRIVHYYYNYSPTGGAARAWTHLDSVVYYPDPTVPSPPTALYTYQTPNVNTVDGAPLLSTAYDPMYEGPMKGISYEYATGTNADTTPVANGQIRSEKSIDGVLVSNLSVWFGARRETKGDGGARDMHLDPPRVVSWTDYVNNSNFASQHFDSTTGFRDSGTDLNHNTTTFTSDPLTGNVTSVTHPQTPGDTPPGTPAGTVSSRYLATCAEDPNNCDAVNPYYLYSATDEAGNTTVYLRDANKRVQRINYPDGAYETFEYNGLGQPTTHRLKTGGIEFFEYDPITHLTTSFRDPYHDPVNHTGKPTAWLQYNDKGWLRSVTDWRGSGPGDINYTTEYEYNLRGQQTLIRHPLDPATQIRYTILRSYNTDGTLSSSTDESSHTTTYNYDAYKRLWWVAAPPADQNDTLGRTTYFHYNRDGTNTLDYTHTDSLVRNFQMPSGKTVITFYNSNLLKTTEIAGTGNEAATTTYTYDNAGNLKTVKDPAGQSTGLYTENFYDERNRPFAANDPLAADRNAAGYTVNWTYDAGGRRKTQQRANEQLVTYDVYDPMNRLKQQSVQRDAGIVDTTLVSYDLAGNLSTFQDARGNLYYYGHDYLGRQTSIVYPDYSSEWFHYDLANNMDTFTNRERAVQTFEHDNRNRQTHYYWDSWPAYTMHERWMSYDERGNPRHVWTEGQDTTDMEYDWRNRKKSETQRNAGRPFRTIGYTYDADSNRKSMTYPSGFVLNYEYDSRNQLWRELDGAGVFATYTYDTSGNRRTRSLRNGTVSNYTPDALNRMKAVVHLKGGTTLGRFDYNYDTVGRVKAVKRDFMRGDFYQYYLDDQLKTAQYDAYNVDLDSPWDAQNATTLAYDANGNRTAQSNTASPNYSYDVNNLNQYTSVNGAVPGYDVLGNLAHYDGWAYGYNRQNHLTDAVNGGTALYFYYDGLDRQILRYENGQWIFSVWDGTDLIEEYDINGQLMHSYVHGAGTDEMIQRFDPGANPNRIWYYQDAQGSTTHLADDSGTVKESYKYPPANSGKPSIFDANGQPIQSSNFGNRFLYTGREYYKDGGFYDYRNRTYLPSLGRFLQPDPIGFAGDPVNLYRYCGNDPADNFDPLGLSGYLSIYSNRGTNIYNTGHSWISFTPFGSNVTTTYGTFSNLTDRPNGVAIGVDGTKADAVRTKWIDDAGERDLFRFIHYMQAKGEDAWHLISPCSSFAAIAWFWGTGEELNDRDVHGIHNPTTLADSIAAANGRGLGFFYMTVGQLPGTQDLVSAVFKAFNKVLAAAAEYGPGYGEIAITTEDGRRTVIARGPVGNPYTSGFTVSPGALSGPALDAWQMTMFGIPGGGPQPGEGTHPVSWELR
ncbi:MAG TPA: RHS repeat-associated core domain-containing protein [Chthoniobacterales bacterium]|nr:RHS repeat-associated core domain-containing protein [Chthoniobacterales bacterium]